MEDKLIYDRYKEIAIASIRQGLEDFLEGNCEFENKSKKEQIQIFTDWVLFCDYFDILRINRELFLKKSLLLKKKGVKRLPSNRAIVKVERSEYGTERFN